MKRWSRSHVGRVVLIALLAALAIVAGSLGTALGLDTSAKDRIEADPPPPLFTEAAIRPTEHDVSAQSKEADKLMSQWFARHGSGRDDSAFVAWVEQVLPPPPDQKSRDAEVAKVQEIAQTRTPSGVRASTWLENYGKKDLWKLYAHDQAEMLTPGRGDAVKNDVKSMLKMAKTIADTLGNRYRQSAPYVLHPSLRPDHEVQPGQVCPCSYPSRHAASGAAAATYLGGLQPSRSADYLWAQGEIDWSRVYMAGHTPSDITGGALLGDMIGEYYLRTRH